MKARKFVQESYDNNDKYARDIFKAFITGKNHFVTKNEEDMMHDVVTLKGGCVYYFELEVKRGREFTTRESFPFGTVSFTGRKIRLHNQQPFWYIIICWESDYALMCHSSVIYNEEYKEQININTVHRQGKDEFYRVPKEKVKFFKIK